MFNFTDSIHQNPEWSELLFYVTDNIEESIGFHQAQAQTAAPQASPQAVGGGVPVAPEGATRPCRVAGPRTAPQDP